MQIKHVGPEHSGGLVLECVPFLSNYARLPCIYRALCVECPQIRKKNRSGCVGSSGNEGCTRRLDVGLS
jgi:hypothetical protein